MTSIPHLDGKRGWLKNKARRKRRDNPFTFTNEDCEALIQKIDIIPFYISPKLGVDLDGQMRIRDKALIASAWLYFKRAREILTLQRRDIKVTESQLIVTFKIQKKRKRCKFCPACGKRNGYRSNFCKHCAQDLTDIEVTFEGETKTSVKPVQLGNKFVRYLAKWVKKLDEISPNSPEVYIFPPLRVVFTQGYFDFYSPMSTANFDRILQRLDRKLTSVHFRYGGSEKLARKNYSLREIKEIGDWSSIKVVEKYLDRKGLLPSVTRWSQEED